MIFFGPIPVPHLLLDKYFAFALTAKSPAFLTAGLLNVDVCPL
jgi:hypothetical protein